MKPSIDLRADQPIDLCGCLDHEHVTGAWQQLQLDSSIAERLRLRCSDDGIPLSPDDRRRNFACDLGHGVEPERLTDSRAGDGHQRLLDPFEALELERVVQQLPRDEFWIGKKLLHHRLQLLAARRLGESPYVAAIGFLAEAGRCQQRERPDALGYTPAGPVPLPYVRPRTAPRD